MIKNDYLAYFGWVLIFDTMCALKNNAMSMSRGFPHGGHSSRVITRRSDYWMAGSYPQAVTCVGTYHLSHDIHVT